MNKAVFLLIGFVVGMACGLFIARREAAPAGPGAAPAAAESAARPQAASRRPSRSDEPALRAAVESLEALVSAVRSGVTYQQYLERKVNAHVAVDHYLNARGQNAPLGVTLTEAVDAFDAAADLWAACVTQEGCTDGLISADNPPPATATVFLRYPGLSSLGNPIPKDIALSYLWQEGAVRVGSARSAL